MMDKNGKFKRRCKINKVNNSAGVFDNETASDQTGIAHEQWAACRGTTETSTFLYYSSNHVAAVHNNIIENNMTLIRGIDVVQPLIHEKSVTVE